MTKERQIEILNNIRNDVYEDSEEDQALYYAIRAIEALATLQPTCNQLATNCIERQAAIAEFNCCELTPDGGIDVNYAIDFLMNMPSAQSDVPDRNVGKWIVSKSDTGKLKTKCSVCGATYSNYLRLIMNYCPNCGAKMEG